jgi:exopolysaccharide biosynthesis polyprenyl glycosylphosphotransferase
MLRRPLKSHALTALMIAADGAALWLLWIAAYNIRLRYDAHFPNPINAFHPSYSRVLAPYMALWWVVLAGYGHYAHHGRISSLNELRRVMQASFVLFLAMPAMAWFLKEFDLGRSVLLFAWALLSLYLYGSRTALRIAKRALIRRGLGVIRVLIYGTGETGRLVAESIRDHPEVGYELVGFVRSSDQAGTPEERRDGPAVVGGRDDLVDKVAELEIDEVFLADPDMNKDDLLNLVVRLEEARVTVKTVSNFLEVITGEFQDEEMADFPVMNLRDGHLPPLQAFVKRLLDLAVVLGTAPIWAPMWGLIALYLKAAQGGPVHFVHERVGRDGKRFQLYKFRTMDTAAPAQAVGPDDPNDPRVTPTGRWLRRTSLDELPQILNVLRGEMSMVGPRPEMPFIVDRYEEWQRRRLDVLPGLTGLWQVIGRKNLPLHYNLEYDFYYIRNQSLWLDLTILARTLPAVIFGKGAF